MKKQKKYEIISETDKVVTFKYDGAECSYAKACYSSIDEVIKEIDEERFLRRNREMCVNHWNFTVKFATLMTMKTNHTWPLWWQEEEDYGKKKDIDGR